MTASAPNSFTFTPVSQEFFAKISADMNPMHMNSLVARRTQSGRPVVHGMHEVVRALDVYAAASQSLPLPAKLTVRFPNPVYLDDTVDVVRLESAAPQLRLQVQVNGLVTADMRFVLDNAAPKISERLEIPVDTRVVSRELSLAEMRGRSGELKSAVGLDEVREALPHASAWIGPHRVAALIILSRLVGMECPGLHSLFSGFTVEFNADTAPTLRYSVASADDHYRMLKIDVSGLGVKGSVEAFARHPPIGQPTIQQVAARVKSDEFAGQCALVVGGSRGLGELTAKLIAAGGGTPIITYAVGRSEAEHVASEIKSFGGNCEAIAYDVRQPAAVQLASVLERATFLYYYATGQIFGRRTKAFDPATLAEFLSYYVNGFYDVCSALRVASKTHLSAFYPSSVAVEQRPRNMTEYSMAKAAGEILCADLNRDWSNIHITTVRLPRLATDQTSTVAPVESASSIDTILPIVRSVQGHRF